MDAKKLRALINKGEVDLNDQSLFLSVISKGFLAELDNKIRIQGKPVPTYILNTGDDIMYLENKGQNAAIEPGQVSNESYIYSKLPRCIVTPKGIQMNTDQLTNPYVRGECQIEYKGCLTTFSAEFRRMPITMSYDLRYVIDSYTDTLQCAQQLITKMAFIQNFNVVYLGQTILCSYRFPDNIEDEKMIQFDGGTNDAKQRTITLSLELSTNMPIYDNRTAIEADMLISKTVSQMNVR